ncbi:hypothetical protein PCANC_11689 [Puccinia coronata f. sp. avenae]|uniref:Uncharacterized protein n=1 Tax=Puccinia coronata f. sp. avenae TaxID=200324 RepID=A0A2N5VXG5_9BASI|nr:hypothetical protein PCANC_16656 [Puccinia coronata f. sp. avenae]PLW54687.1 hypothetical protein PCANC_11689 [Puccinia coronata f. sp. avenae]
MPETQLPVAMPETQLPVMISQQTQLPYTYPMVTKLFDVVPLPFTQEYAAPAGTVIAPNSLCLVCKFGGTLADFPSNPHTFSILGQSPKDAKDFVNEMQATVLWVGKKCPKKEPKVAIPASEPLLGRPKEFLFVMRYRCPCNGFY